MLHDAPWLRWLVVAVLAATATAIAARFFLGGAPAGTPAATSPPPGEMEGPRFVSGPGTVQARVPVTISSRISAPIVALHADHGDFVRKGAVLAELDDRDLAARRSAAAAARETSARNVAAARASLAKAKADLELARSRHRRDADLQRSAFISQSAYEASALALAAAEAAVANAAALVEARRAEGRAADEEVRYAEALWSSTRLVSPMDALVIQRAAEVGSLASPGAPIFRLVDPATLWVSARIDEALVAQVDPGMPATILLRSGETYAGRVARISRQSDPATRELEVNVAFDTPPERFAIDQEAMVRIAVDRTSGAGAAPWTSR